MCAKERKRARLNNEHHLWAKSATGYFEIPKLDARVLKHDETLFRTIQMNTQNRSRAINLLLKEQDIFDGDSPLVYAAQSKENRSEVLDLAKYLSPESLIW